MRSTVRQRRFECDIGSRVSFAVEPEAYDRFMGRYSVQLAPQLADFADVRAGQRAVDVGCGPGALTEELARRLGPEAVSAADPSESFVLAARERYPGVDVRLAAAEELPFPDGAFDAALAQLVVPFMADPVAGLREMGRVTGEDGMVAACVWDHSGDRSPLTLFWRAVRELRPDARDESALPGAREGHLAGLFREAGLRQVEDTALAARVEYASFEDWWEPYTSGVGPAGAYVRGLDADARSALQERCRALLPAAPFTLDAHAWAARGLA
jgi:SAM-dependent methyltransferase